MILNHLWGLYAHPKEEWHTIDARHESFRYSLIHILLVALIPSVCAYYSAVHLGWSIGVGDRIMLTHDHPWNWRPTPPRHCLWSVLPAYILSCGW